MHNVESRFYTLKGKGVCAAFQPWQMTALPASESENSVYDFQKDL